MAYLEPMFSGIIEALSTATAVAPRGDVIQLTVSRPTDFNDLKAGDSVAVNGVCLTIETFDEASIQFALPASSMMRIEA